MSFGESVIAADGSSRDNWTTVLALTREKARRPGAPDHLDLVAVKTWNPKASPTGEIDYDEVRAYIKHLASRLRVKAFRYDQGAESSAFSPLKSYSKLALVTEPFVATADSNMAIWSALAARLQARTLSIPRHERLLAELRGLRKESFSFGSKFRVIDASKKFHRDVSFALALAVWAMGDLRTCTSPLCSDPECTGRPPFQLLFTRESEEWDKRHPSAADVAANEAAVAAVEAQIAEERRVDEDESKSLADGLRALAAEGYSRLTHAMRARAEARANRPAPPTREERLARYFAEQERGREQAEEKAAAERNAAYVRDQVQRSGGVWFPDRDY